MHREHRLHARRGAQRVGQQAGRTGREQKAATFVFAAPTLKNSGLDKKDARSLQSVFVLDLLFATHVPMRNLRFDFFDDSGLPRDSRILMFYSFETDERLPRSGILHYHVGEGRFVGPRHDRELTSAALEFLATAGRLPGATAKS